jgi:transcription elongation factor GreB
VSRAFVSEERIEDSGGEAVPERVQGAFPNYVTPRGLAALSRKVDDLARARHEADAIEDDDRRRQETARIDRDLRYFHSRLEGAVPVDPARLADDHVHFGSEVRVVDDGGREHTFVIVGEDEADPAKGWVSWASPLARALMNAREGDVVTWMRPSGGVELEVVAFRNAFAQEVASEPGEHP